MEEKIAILMADLAGYTALTETHGASAAADLVDKYISMANDALAGDTWLHQRTGDELMILSHSAADLLQTAQQLMEKAEREEHFLRLHGGMHYGSVLQRNGSYFGNAINLTARITSKAKAGRIICSEEFLQELANPFSFSSTGPHHFKNVMQPKELFELVAASTTAHIDPVCRMLINTTSHRHQFEDVFFCSHSCLDTYMGRRA